VSDCNCSIVKLAETRFASDRKSRIIDTDTSHVMSARGLIDGTGVSAIGSPETTGYAG